VRAPVKEAVEKIIELPRKKMKYEAQQQQQQPIKIAKTTEAVATESDKSAWIKCGKFNLKCRGKSVGLVNILHRSRDFQLSISDTIDIDKRIPIEKLQVVAPYLLDIFCIEASTSEENQLLSNIYKALDEDNMAGAVSLNDKLILFIPPKANLIEKFGVTDKRLICAMLKVDLALEEEPAELSIKIEKKPFIARPPHPDTPRPPPPQQQQQQQPPQIDIKTFTPPPPSMFPPPISHAKPPVSPAIDIVLPLSRPIPEEQPLQQQQQQQQLPPPPFGSVLPPTPVMEHVPPFDPSRISGVPPPMRGPYMNSISPPPPRIHSTNITNPPIPTLQQQRQMINPPPLPREEMIPPPPPRQFVPPQTGMNVSPLPHMRNPPIPSSQPPPPPMEYDRKRKRDFSTTSPSPKRGRPNDPYSTRTDARNSRSTSPSPSRSHSSSPHSSASPSSQRSFSRSSSRSPSRQMNMNMPFNNNRGASHTNNYTNRKPYHNDHHQNNNYHHQNNYDNKRVYNRNQYNNNNNNNGNNTMRGNHHQNGRQYHPRDNQQPTRFLWVGRFYNMKIEYNTIRHDFEEFGPLESVNLLRDQKCAFVNFRNYLDAQEAKKALEGTPKYQKIVYTSNSRYSNNQLESLFDPSTANTGTNTPQTPLSASTSNIFPPSNNSGNVTPSAQEQSQQAPWGHHQRSHQYHNNISASGTLSQQ
jgi:hypothetical protein